MKNSSSKFVYRNDSELYGGSADQFETFKTLGVLTTVILSILMAFQFSNVIWQDFINAMGLMNFHLPY